MKPFHRLSLLLLVVFCRCVTPCAWAEAAPQFNHVAVYVRDLKISTDFYQKVVGLETVPEPFHDGRHTWFKIGPSCTLHVISGATETLAKEKRAHLCFSVESVDAFILRLKQHKVSYENLAGEKSAVTKRPDGVQQIYLQDPDGYWLEFSDAKQ